MKPTTTVGGKKIMHDVGQKREQHRHIWKYVLGILMCVAIFGVIAWAQKSSNESEKGVTLADLGVTAAQQTEIKALWELKRQKQIQAVADLKTLNRLVRDSLANDTEIQETLDVFRMKRKEMQERIDEVEEGLIQTLPPRAQLHLTVLGVLNNGIPRKMSKSQASKKTDGNSTPSPEQERE